MATLKVGEVVRYSVGLDMQLAEIVELSGSTHAIIRIKTGPQEGQEFEAPRGLLKSLSESNEAQ